MCRINKKSINENESHGMACLPFLKTDDYGRPFNLLINNYLSISISISFS